MYHIILVSESSDPLTQQLTQGIDTQKYHIVVSTFTDLKMNIEAQKEIQLFIINVLDIQSHKNHLDFLQNSHFNSAFLFLININDEQHFSNTCPLFAEADFLFKPLHFIQLKHRLAQYLQRYEEQLQFTKESTLIHNVIESFESPVFITDGVELIFANHSFLNFFSVNSIDFFNDFYENISTIFLEKEGYTATTDTKPWTETLHLQRAILINKRGKQLIVKLSSYINDDKSYVVTTQDITKEYRHSKELEFLYFNDSLTGLPNRKKLLQTQQKYASSKLSALAILDIDTFSEINDFYGYQIGDFIIYEIYKRIEKFIAHDSLQLFRLPGDSFAIYSHNNIEHEYFEIIILSLIQVIIKHPFIFDDNQEKVEVYINISCGLAFGEEATLGNADLALHSAKKSRTNAVTFDQTLSKSKQFHSNLTWIQKIKDALKHDRIVPYFQPIVNNDTLKVEKYECLVRLIDSDDKVISPYFFLDIAKKTKLYESLTKTMISKSMKHFANLPYKFSINLSMEDIQEYNIIEFIKSMLNIYPVAQRVVFEILETEDLGDYADIIAFTKEVRSLGCHVSIDDFGSGYSNFSHLINLDFDYLKIDATLIKDIHKDPARQTVLKTLVAFAKDIGTQTVAEFVESKEIYDFIKEIGIDYSQGYYFAQPKPVTLLEDSLLTHT